MPQAARRAFTIIELLVVVSIIALLVGILLPAIGKARDQAKVTISQANLRNLGTAHQSYAAEWSDRQVTFINDNASTYGSFGDWFANFAEAHGSDLSWDHAQNHPAVYLGWGHGTGGNGYHFFRWSCVQSSNASMCIPMNIGNSSVTDYFGSFRVPNAAQFHQYVGGRFYDETFYAPKDRIPIESAAQCFESPDQYCPEADVAWSGGNPAWSSYCMSPAGMYNASVFAHDDPVDETFNGFVDPWDLQAGFRSPSFSQCLFPSLKTHMLEHHWLQNPLAECNPGMDPGTYGPIDCEPYYFNHAWESSPVTLFYDGHVESVGVRNTMRADGRMRQQTGHENWGLWSKDTPFGEDGYLSEYGYDQAQTSFHILTTDGIRGRDMLGD